MNDPERAAMQQAEPVREPEQPALPAGFRQDQVPSDYNGRVWIEGQVRRYGALCVSSAVAAARRARSET
jgi:hypothetical protein